jgi:hypothetical protein
MAFIGKDDVPFGIKVTWASVLRRAVFDYVLYKGSGQYALEWRSAYKYIFVKNVKYEGGFSFEEVCALFDWDPDYLRRMVVKLTRADIKKMEIGPHREEFTFDYVDVAVQHVERWKTASFAVPFCPYCQYNDEYTSRLTPKIIEQESYIGNHIPFVSWNMATA